jgi:hypothetical protein
VALAIDPVAMSTRFRTRRRCLGAVVLAIAIAVAAASPREVRAQQVPPSRSVSPPPPRAPSATRTSPPRGESPAMTSRMGLALFGASYAPFLIMGAYELGSGHSFGTYPAGHLMLPVAGPLLLAMRILPNIRNDPEAGLPAAFLAMAPLMQAGGLVLMIAGAAQLVPERRGSSRRVAWSVVPHVGRQGSMGLSAGGTF